MAKLEKVIRGLECCLDINHEKYKHCLSCQYRDDIDHLQWACMTDGILEDALSLLKAQEPRVMTLEEAVEHAKNPQFEWSEKAPVYIEYYIKRPSYVKWLIAESLNDWLNDDRKEDYNRAGDFGWRCWTSRPTDEQMEKVKWDD